MTEKNPVDAWSCSDRQWWNETGMCGCGDYTCHPGRPCGTITDDGIYGHTVCSRCSFRHDQGFHIRGRCQCAAAPVVPQVESLPLFGGTQ